MDTNKLKELAERARDKGDWYKASSVDAFPEFHIDQEFMVATSPDVVLWLIAEVERLEAELSQCVSALPGTYYMDPPDGGNVSIPEQIRRMAKDAARYRWLRERDLETISRGGVFAGMTPENIVLNLEDLDAEIDAAIEGAKQ
ncbi:TPA: hypothetical protein ACQSRZ_005009 [Pseudomonas aeruginosa]